MTSTLTIHSYTPSEVGVCSDIHGDIDMLIIILRDILGVIRKKPNHVSNLTSQRDPELDFFLNIDLNNIPHMLNNPSLNYEW